MGYAVTVVYRLSGTYQLSRAPYVPGNKSPPRALSKNLQELHQADKSSYHAILEGMDTIPPGTYSQETCLNTTWAREL